MTDSASPAAPEAPGGAPLATGDEAFDALLLRMQAKGDFPALSDSVGKIIEITSSERGSVAELSDQILRDVALTQKLLRLVNSVHYASPGRTGVTSVSRAVIMLGFNAVRNMALSVVLLDHMDDKANAAQLKQDLLHAMLAGTLAGEFSPTPADAEEAFIGAMFQNLGRMLAGFYFPDEAATVRRLVAARAFASGEEGASVKTLGVSYENFGLNVARLWGMPESLLRYMRKPEGQPPARAPEALAERMRWVAAGANEVAEALLQAPPAELPHRLSRLTDRYARALGLAPRAMDAAVLRAREKLRSLAQALRIDPPAAARRG